MGWLPGVMARVLMTAIGIELWCQYLSATQYDLDLQKQEPEEAGCFPALFSFGSSVADTGTQAIALPFSRAEDLPYGSTFFGKPSKRYSDGRLHIDFWALALNIPFLDPYLKSMGSNFRRGVNFAAAASTAANNARPSPFTLSVQLNQFREFKRDVFVLIDGRSRQRYSKHSTYHDSYKLPEKQYFRDGLYVIAIGGNDIRGLFENQQLTIQEVELQVPQVSLTILGFVEALYAEGARNILVEDVYPIGCMSGVLQKFTAKYFNHLDDAGCLKPFNAMVQLHNSLLKQGAVELGRRLGPDASIAVIDTYSKRYDIIANYGKYGLKVPLKPCYQRAEGDNKYRSGNGYGESITVYGRMFTASMCDNVSSHVMWDTYHFTDAVNQVVMRGIMSGKYFEPDFDIIPNNCTLVKI